MPPPYRLRSIAQYHRFRGLPGPAHPLVSVVRIEDIARLRDDEPARLVQSFYSVALKTNVNAQLGYGRTDYDFGTGRLVFIAPDQVYSLTAVGDLTHTGWLLLLHPDLLFGTPLAEGIRRYEFFGYAVHEALHLSEREEAVLVGVLGNLATECASPVDLFSKSVLVAQIEVLLNYADRFYHRQFLTREKSHHELLARLENELTAHFADADRCRAGLPTVTELAAALHVSPGYLTTLVRVHTGQPTQRYVQDRLVAEAKARLLAPGASVGAVAYGLGFGHISSFSRFFRGRVGVGPLGFLRGVG